jgi:hypothetical protein
VEPEISKLKHTLRSGLALELNPTQKIVSLSMGCSNDAMTFGSKLQSILARKL